MASKVAIVELGQDAKQSYAQALRLVGGIADLDKKDCSVVIKVGVFDPKSHHHATVDVVDAIVGSFSKAPQIYLAESDNYRGKGMERLQIWKTLFSKRVVPFDLSQDADVRQVKIVGETVNLSHVLFKPNVLVSTHNMRIFEMGSIIKNLLGLTPDKKKARFHRLGMDKVLVDLYEAVGGIDLAVLDGTRLAMGVMPNSEAIETNVLVVGRDAVAVEAVGASLAGMKLEKMPVLQEAMKRGLGEGNLDKIEILGASFEAQRERIRSLIEASKRVKKRTAKKKAAAKKSKSKAT